MTAYVNIVVNRRDNVLMVPNAALRYRPAEQKAATNGGQDTNAPKKRKDAANTTVYVLDAGKLRAVSITLGITDNRNTEVAGGDLKAGETIIVGENLSGAEAAPSGNLPRLRMF